MPEKILLLEASSAPFLIVAQVTRTGYLANMLYKLALVYDVIKAPLIESALIKGKYHDVAPYATLESLDLSDSLHKVSTPNAEDIAHLHKAYNEPETLEEGYYAYYGTRAVLMKAAETSSHFYVLPRFREGFLGFCAKYQSDYLDSMKQSFLCFDILELIFDEQLSSFNPELTLEQVKRFTPFKPDFQNGVFDLLNDLLGNYRLSEEQKTYIRKKLAAEEQQLLEFLKPENLKKFNISKLDIATEIVSMASPVPLPIGVLVSVAKEIKEIHDFKKKNLDFIFSLYILKKLASKPTPLEIPKCRVCSLTEAEIEQMSKDECDKIALSGQFCTRHIVAYLDLRKRYSLFGKDLLLTMKKFDELI